jgi:ornithine cyclodeaminase
MPPATRLIDVKEMTRLIATVGLAELTAQITEAIGEDFRRWPAFEKCARTANHSPDGVIELMPISDDERYSFKFVNGHPRNGQFGLPTVMAFGVLADVATGFPLLISEMTVLTAIRTAATSALAARALARPDSQSVAMIGNGAQAEFQIIAFHRVLGIRDFRLYDPDLGATDKVLRNLAHLDINLTVAASVAAAVRGADIVTTCTAAKTRASILTREMIEPGMHLNAIGGDCPGKTELPVSVVENCRVVVEFAPQTRIEGEIQQTSWDFGVTELWSVLAGASEGRESEEQVTLFDSVGFALEDYSALRTVYGIAEREGFGTTIDLVPEMPNVKDLFAVL